MGPFKSLADTKDLRSRKKNFLYKADLKITKTNKCTTDSEAFTLIHMDSFPPHLLLEHDMQAQCQGFKPCQETVQK